MLEVNVKVTGETTQLLAYALQAAALQVAGGDKNGWCDVLPGGRMTFAVGKHPVELGAQERGDIQRASDPLEAIEELRYGTP